MATRTIAIGGGNWSATGTWVEGVVPTSADDVVALPAGASGQLTINAAAACRSFDHSNGGGTITHSTGITLTVGDGTAGAGNKAFVLAAGDTYTLGSTTTSAIAFVSTSATVQTIDFAGKNSGNVTFNGVGGTWKLTGAWGTSAAAQVVTLTNGTLDTNGQACFWGSFSSSNSNVRALMLGASSVTTRGTGTVWNVANAVNFTFNAGTSLVTINQGAAISCNTLAAATFYDMNRGGNGVCTTTIPGGASFHNLTRTGSGGFTDSLTITGGVTVTITGTFTVSSASGLNGVIVQSTVVGSTVTVRANAVSLTNTDFADVLIYETGLTGFTNLLTGDQSDFEGSAIGTAGQIAGTTTSRDTSEHWEGTASFKVVCDGSNASQGQTVTAGQRAPVTAGTDYVGSAYVKGSGSLQLSLRYYDASNVLISAFATSTFVADGTWTRHSATGTAPAGAVYALVSVACVVTQASTFWLDGVQLEAGTVASAWVRGGRNSTGTSLGDAQGNSGITFDARTTQTYVGGTKNWSDVTAWTSRVPLPQDDVIVNTTTAGTLTADMPRLGRNIDFTGFTRTYANNLSTTIYGNLTYGAGMTVSGTNGHIFAGRGAQTATFNGKTIPAGFGMTGFGGSLTLQDDMTLGGSNLTVTAGTLNDGGHNINSPNLLSTGTITRAIVSSGTWTITGTGTIINFSSSGLTVSHTGTFVLSDASATTKTVAFGGVNTTYGTIQATAGGSGALIFTSLFNATNLIITTTTARTVTFKSSGSANVVSGTVTFHGAAGQLLSLVSDVPGTQWRLSKASGIVSADYVSLTDSRAQGGATFYAGNHSTNVSNNTGWIFTEPILTPTGVPTGGALGVPLLAGTAYPAGVASATAFGAPAFSARLYAVPVASAAAIPAPSLSSRFSITGISSAEDAPAPRLLARLYVPGIVSEEYFYPTSISLTGYAAGVPSEEDAPAPLLLLRLYADAVGSGEDVPAARLSATSHLTGVPSEAAVSEPALAFLLRVPAIGPGPLLPVPRLVATVSATGVPSGAVVGAPVMRTRVYPGSVPSGLAIGDLTAAPGARLLLVHTRVSGWGTLCRVMADPEVSTRVEGEQADVGVTG